MTAEDRAARVLVILNRRAAHPVNPALDRAVVKRCARILVQK